MQQSDYIVMGKAGLRGRLVSSNQRGQANAAQVELQLEDGRRVLLPASLLQQQSDGSYYLPLSLEQVLEQGQLVVPVVEEELIVGRQRVTTGVVRVHKEVREVQQTVDEPTYREEAQIERIAINQFVDHAPEPRTEGDVLIIPVLEEVLVVEKRLRLKEELRVSMVRTAIQQPQTVTLRREEIHVERVPLHEREINAGTEVD
ncbi:MAG: YsnF/AvaK domain-containing protein [Chloroflexaceae bacterium]|nr:YsnF/AvaK domain-containing protein [Chloroflexaceae bacterium]